MFRDQNQLVETLVASNLLTKQAATDLFKQAAEKKKSPEELLLTGRIISENDLVDAKAKLLNVPVADLQNKTIDKKVLNLIPKEVADNYQMVPFAKDGNELHIGLVNPQNFKAIEAVEFLAQKAGLKVRYFIISLTSFHRGLRQYQALGEEVKQALAGISEQQRTVEKTAEESLKEMEEVDE